MKFVFIGAGPRLYQFFEAQPGEVFDFDSEADVPTDGLWIPADPTAVTTSESASAAPTEPASTETADPEADASLGNPTGE